MALYTNGISRYLKIFHASTKEYAIYLATPESICKIDQTLGHKIHLNKLRKKYTLHILADHYAIMLKINRKTPLVRTKSHGD